MCTVTVTLCHKQPSLVGVAAVLLDREPHGEGVTPPIERPREDHAITSPQSGVVFADRQSL